MFSFFDKTLGAASKGIRVTIGLTFDPKVIELSSYSTQLSMKLRLLINLHYANMSVQYTAIFHG